MLTILKTLGIIMALENTVNVNVILNGMRHIPIRSQQKTRMRPSR